MDSAEVFVRSRIIGVRVEAGLAAATCPQAAADAVALVARTARIDAAVDGAGDLGQGVDILHDVDLAVLRPLARAQHPERRPVAQASGRLLDRGGDLELAAGRGADVGAGGLHPPRRPVAAAALRRDVQVAAAVEMDVAGRVRHRLDLAGAEARARTGVVHPLAVDAAAGGAAEVVEEHLVPARGRRGRGGLRGAVRRRGPGQKRHGERRGHGGQAPEAFAGGAGW